MQYTGQWNQVASQLTLITRDRKGSIDEVLRPDTDFRTGIQDAVWYMPDDGHAAIALGNTTGADISATITLPVGQPRPVLLRPFETQVIIVNQTDLQSGAATHVASVHVETSAPAGALRAIGYVTFGSGLVHTIRFYERATVRQPHLFAANLPIQNSEIQMVLKNIGDMPLTATPAFLPVSSGANALELPAITLQPGEAKLVDCAALQELAATNNGFSRVSVHVRNSGEKGTLIGSLSSVNLQTGISYEIPLRDSGSLRNAGGGYPLRLDGDYSTFVTLFNVSDEPALFRAVIRHLSDDYFFRSRTLAPGESAIFDIRDLRDRQIPDPYGKTLPADFERGQFNWTMLQGGAETRLIGRSEIVSPSRGVSASYSCGLPCPASGPMRIFNPSQLTLTVGGFQAFTTIERYTDSYNQIWDENIAFSFTSLNPSIADSYYLDPVLGQAEAHGYAPGSTLQSTGQYSYVHYYDDGTDCYVETWPMQSDQTVEVKPTVTLGSLTAVGKNQTAAIQVTISPSNNTVPVTLTLSTSSGTGTAQFASNSSSTTTLTQSASIQVKGITESSTSNNIRLTASAQNNQTLATSDFTVILVTFSLRTSGTVSSDNAARQSYITSQGTANLGTLQNTTYGEWITGVELVGTVKPTDFSQAIVLERVATSRTYEGQTLTGSKTLEPDTSLPQYRDDLPLSGGSQGVAYDTDTPFVNILSPEPVGLIRRHRVNLVQWASVNGIRVSDDFFWFSRLSVVKTSSGNVLDTSISGDNVAGAGSTILTWNLQ